MVEESGDAELVNSKVFVNRELKKKKKIFNDTAVYLLLIPMLSLLFFVISVVALVALSIFFLYYTPRVSRSLLPVCNTGYCYSLQLGLFGSGYRNYSFLSLKDFWDRLEILKELNIESVFLEQKRFLLFDNLSVNFAGEILHGVPRSCRELGIGLITDIGKDERNYSDYYISLGIQGFIITVSSFEELKESLDEIIFWGDKIHNADYNVKGKLILRYIDPPILDDNFVEFIRNITHHIDYIIYRLDVQNKNYSFVSDMPKSMWVSGRKDFIDVPILYDDDIPRTHVHILLTAYLGTVIIESHKNTFQQYDDHFHENVSTLPDDEKGTMNLLNHIKNLKDTFKDFESLGEIKEIELEVNSKKYVIFKRLVLKPSFFKSIYFMMNLREFKDKITLDVKDLNRNSRFQMLFGYPTPLEADMYKPITQNITLNYGEAVIFGEIFS